MRLSLKTFIACAAVLGLCLGVARARVPDRNTDRYQGIPERNLFGLKPRVQPTAEPTQMEPPTKLFLTGITTILGSKRALLKEQPPVGKPATPGADQSLILSEGQRENGVEVLQIDPKSGKVKVNNSGVIQTLTFEKDGVKTPAAPTAPPPLPTATSAPFSAAGAVQPGLSRRALPSRTPRWPGAASAAAPGVAAAPPAATGSIFPANPAPQPIPTPTGSPTGQPQPTSAAPGGAPPEVQNQLQPELSLEQQVMVELQREEQQQGTGNAAGAPGTAAPGVPGVPNAPTTAPGVTQPETAPGNVFPNAPTVYPQ